MPTDSTYLEVVIAFAMIGLLGLILRFTFGRDVRDPYQFPEGASEGEAAETQAGARPPSYWHGPTLPPGRAHRARRPSPPAAEDFGLLAPVALTDTAEAATALRELLATAGIRATTTLGQDGRFRVLVFSAELDRARRVSG